MNVKVEYDGEYPNLCSGQLFITINNTRWKFPSFCLSSGGGVSFGDNYDESVWDGEWTISSYPDNFPEELKQIAEDAVNSEITHGCCGGCV